MLITLFKYFAPFVKRSGVAAMATLGQQSTPLYDQLLQFAAQLPDDGLIPSIDHYVFAQSFDELQQRLQRLAGTFLYVDYGEITFSQGRARTLDATMRIAVTVARKTGDRTDPLARLVASNDTLASVLLIYRRLLADADAPTADAPTAGADWLSRDTLLAAELVPFVATELSASGWTLMFDATSPAPFRLSP